jgi:hypothetical protein
MSFAIVLARTLQPEQRSTAVDLVTKHVELLDITTQKACIAHECHRNACICVALVPIAY